MCSRVACVSDGRRGDNNYPISILIHPLGTAAAHVSDPSSDDHINACSKLFQ